MTTAVHSSAISSVALIGAGKIALCSMSSDRLDVVFAHPVRPLQAFGFDKGAYCGGYCVDFKAVVVDLLKRVVCITRIPSVVVAQQANNMKNEWSKRVRARGFKERSH